LSAGIAQLEERHEQSGGWQDIFWLHVPLYLIINCHGLLHDAKINYIFDNKAKHTLNPANRHGPMNGHKLESFSLMIK
jgi:hypothetical protein